MTAIKRWVECDPIDDRPTHGPSCPGPDTHRWHLSIEEGRMGIGSGCEDCDLAIHGEDVYMDDIAGALTFHHEVMGYETPEHVVWWEFTPSKNGRSTDA